MKTKRDRTVVKNLCSALLLCAGMILFSACGAPKQQETEISKEEEHSSVETTVQESSETEESVTAEAPLRLAALKGPTSMGMAYVLSSGDQERHSYDCRVLGSPEEIVPLLVKKEIDVAAVPSNLAAVLYAKTEGNIQVLNINTLGVLYLVERGERVHAITDLKGRTVLASGKGATPEYALRYLLEANGLSEDEVSIEWKSEHAEVVAALAENPDAVALLPEPFVSSAEANLADLRRAVDLTEAWDAAQNKNDAPSALVMGVLVARREIVNEHPDAIAQLLADVTRSVDKVKQNPEEAAKIISELGIVPEAVVKKAIPHANLVSITGVEMKEKLGGYLRVLAEQDVKAIGGALPADDFYFLPEGQR
ncbi:ABC transporter substrate-binding protein [Murdochiella sp. Marseille-P8839]|nr:ABC transporter substrate-binding protein [Murdochiella sp. Marseille-P8839]